MPRSRRKEILRAHLGLDPRNSGVVDRDVFASIYNPGKVALLVSWKDADAARQFVPERFAGVKGLRHRLVRVVRDYGKFDRREAPQFYPDARGARTSFMTSL
jgi:hypothetical protein